MVLPPGWRCTFTMIAGETHPRRLRRILHAVDDVGHVGQHHRGAVAVGHHHLLVVLAGHQLIVGVDLEVLMRAVKVTLGGIDAGVAHRRAQVFEVDPIRRQRRRIHLDAHRRLLSAADAHQAHPAQLRYLRRQPRIHQVLDLRQWHGVRRDRQRQHWSIRRVGLTVDRRGRQIRGQKALRRIDRRLHLFLGDIDIQAQIKLQHDDRIAG
jgi:hypothetical protein